MPSFPICLPSRVRAQGPLDIYVNNLNGSDLPSQGLTYGTNGCGAFATPGYATAWCNANLDAAGQQVRILVDATSQPYTTTPMQGLSGGAPVGGILLYDVLGCIDNWSNCPAPIKICGAVDGVALGNGPQNGPLLSFDGLAAVCGVGCNTVWQLEDLQLQSTIADVIADRGAKINILRCANGAFSNGYPSPQKYAAEYGSSIEILGQIWVNTGGSTLWAANVQANIIGMGPAPIIAPGVSFSATSQKDDTGVLALPADWPQ